jgi:phthiocerol/phenolphthiocerol synthesis type-I polyketide synthase C
VPVTTFDLADAEQAFRLMAQARHIGKVVLTVDEGPYRVTQPRGRAPVQSATAPT